MFAAISAAAEPVVTRDKQLSDLPTLLWIREVAVYLDISEWKARELCHTGTLRSRRVGRQYRVHRDDLAAYLSSIASK